MDPTEKITGPLLLPIGMFAHSFVFRNEREALVKLRSSGRMSITGKMGHVWRHGVRTTNDRNPVEDAPLDADGLADYLAAFLGRRIKLRRGQVFRRDTSLRTLGIDSLTLVKIAGEIEAQLAIEIEPALLFEATTIADLARMLQTLREGVSYQPSE